MEVPRTHRPRGRADAGYDARVFVWLSKVLDWFVSPYVTQLETEIALHGKDPAEAEASIRQVATELSLNPRFDAWGEGLFRLDRIAADARRAGRTALAADGIDGEAIFPNKGLAMWATPDPVRGSSWRMLPAVTLRVLANGGSPFFSWDWLSVTRSELVM